MITSHRLSISTVALLIGLGTAPALAQTTASGSVAVTPATTPQNVTTNSSTDTMQSDAIDRMVDRDLNQENRIEQGLKSGALTDSEAAQLERGEARIDRVESADLRNGQLSAQEIAQIQNDQNAESTRIYQLKHNGTTTTTPTSTDPLQADVQRDINQQTRIGQGVNNGSLTTTELSNLERGQARIDRDEARAGRNDSLSAQEQDRIQTAQGFQSGGIYNDKHNSTTVTSNTIGSSNGGGRDGNGLVRSDIYSYNGHRDDHDRWLRHISMNDGDNSNVTTSSTGGTSVTANTTSSTTIAAGDSTSSVAASASPSTNVTAGATAPVTSAAPVVTPHVTAPVVHAPVVHAHK